MKVVWKAVVPPALAIALALLPAPHDLPQHAWYYFALFAGVIAGLVLEPLPGGAVGLIGVTYALLLCVTLGIMGLISPYATGPSPVYCGSGYLPAADYWKLGAIFGALALR